MSHPLSVESFIPEGYDPDLYRIRHSAAHVLAQAVIERFTPEGVVHIAIGPPIADGFYYDFGLPRPVREEDLAWLEARMRAIITADHAFIRQEVSADQARALFHDQPFKLELIDGLGDASVISTYQQDTFLDLCRGPHVHRTSEIPADALRLLSVSGAYWQGDEQRPMLQRIYGTAFKSADDLAYYLWQRAEAEKRDHRKIGRDLDLFHLDPSAPGMPYWLPKGTKLLNELLAFWREEHEQRDYQEIMSPLINQKQLWETSGHWEHYREDMFQFALGDQTVYGIKPMNCPNAMLVYNLKLHSYRDLPLRLSDCDVLHRHERSGTLHGLLRVQKFIQDDAHIFVTEDQIEDEYERIFEIVDRFYQVFGLQYRFRLGTRPAHFIGEPELWEKAEALLRRILDQRVGPGHYTVLDGDGAFYAPKVDILMQDAIGRSWQMGTIQLDFHLPRRFNCLYTDRDGQRQHPAVIHRVIYGSLERFIGILLEHTAGALPVWISPLQVRVLAVSEPHQPYAERVLTQLRQHQIRAELDRSQDRLNAKIRAAQLQKIPYMLIVGAQEAADQTVSVRLRSGETLDPLPLSAFIAHMQAVIRSKSLSL
ncbi:MAG: threonine--tRNA ligase [Anaerolineae bacterium]|nr:threonine--tRNA ligase [Anaerolineae bacterium]